uniref:Cleavage and polyadenylation specific factor 1 n=1 Tax=Hippocampus comes TaxID=109280 RepID=A0A3Q2YCG2_HIPCM
MYAVHRQAHTPTAVEFSVYCNFISSKEKNLVVAGTSQLFVYRIIHDVEVDEIEVYGSEAQSGTQLATYSFEVCDSILNIGPCTNASMGEPAFLSEEFQANTEPDLEVVVCSGFGKNGALSVLQRSIRPQVVTTFELPGCHDMWTVVSSEVKEKESDDGGDKEMQKRETPLEDDAKKHGFLILSREDSTMILQTGQEIMELDTSGFATQGTTVFAGNIGDNKYIIQVSPMGIRLLEGVTQLHFIPVDLGTPIVHCSVADPYVVIMTADGVVTMFVLKTDSYMGKTQRLSLRKPQIPTQSRVIALCAYRDVSGMFTTENRVSCPVVEDTNMRSVSEVETLCLMLVCFCSNTGRRHRDAAPHAGEDVSPTSHVAERSQHLVASSRRSKPESFQVQLSPRCYRFIS